MKLAYVTTIYDDYLNKFNTHHPDLNNLNYQDQKAKLDYDAFGWFDVWSHALNPLGYEVLEITLNAEIRQRKWALENNLSNVENIDLNTIAIRQLQHFQPDILWFDNHRSGLLQEIRKEVPSIKLVLGWSGSAVCKTDMWQFIDLVLSCAPEAIEYFQQQGMNAEHLHHGFDPRVNARLQPKNKNINLCFIGQIVRSSDFHFYREQLLEKLASNIPLEIFSSSYNYSPLNNLKVFTKSIVYDLTNKIKRLGINEEKLANIPFLNKASQWQSKPILPVNPKLMPYLRPAVYGVEMYQTLLESKIALNIHADSSPIYASNMRLFETLGVGTCLLTDWKDNLHELFEPEKEVVTYKSVEECIEKVQWLLNHPKEREAIAKAGQARTLKDHTFDQRAIQLDAIIRQVL